MTYEEYKRKYQNATEQATTKDKATASTAQKTLGSYDRYKQKYGDYYKTNVVPNSSSVLEKFVEDYNAFVEEATRDQETVNFDNARSMWATYSQRADALSNRASNLAMYVHGNKDFLGKDSYDWATSMLSSATSGIRSLRDYYSSVSSDYSKFGSQDEYDAAVRRSGYQQTYQGKSYGDIQALLPTLQDGEEKEWLTEYAQSVMTVEDYDRLIAEAEEKLRTVGDDMPAGMSGFDQYALEEKMLSELPKELEELQEKRLAVANAEKYAAIRQNADFAEKSKYVSTYRGGEKFNALSGTYTDSGFDDILYDYINRNETAVDRQRLSDISHDTALLGLDNSERGEMTKDEIATFNYIYATQGRDEAYAYIDYLESDLNARQRETSEAQWAEYAKAYPVRSSVFSILESPLKGVSYLGQVADYVSDGKIDQNAGYNKFSYTNSAIRDEVGSIVENNWGAVGSFAYQTGMSMGDFLFNTAVSGGYSPLSLAIMGTGAAADTTIAAKDRGLSDDQAFALGTIAGAAEIITEKFSLEALLDMTSLSKSAVGYVLKNVLAEGSEEVGSSLINLVADVLISKDKSEWQQTINAYQEVYNDEGKAIWHAVLDQAASLGLDFLGGSLSGGIMGGGSALIMGHQQKNAEAKAMYGELAGELVGEALELNPGSSFANRMQGRLDKGKDLSGGQLRNLVKQNEKAIRQQDVSTIEQAAISRLQELGETGDVDAIAKALAKQASGKTLSRAEKQLIQDSKYGARLSNELNPENIRSGEYSTGWAQQLNTNRINPEEYSSLVEAAQQPQEAAENAQGKVAPKMPNAAQTAAQEAPVATVQENRTVAENATVPANDQQVTGKLTGKESLQVAEDGKTILQETGEEVSIKEIANVSGGQITLRLDNGSTVKAQDIAYGSEGEAMIYEAVASLNADADISNILVSNYLKDDGGVSAGDYALGMVEAFRYGTYNIPRAELADNQFAAKLTDTQRNSAYLLGERFGGKQTGAANSQARRARFAQRFSEAAANKGESKPKTATGKVHFDGDRNSLTERQSTSLSAMEKVAEALGVQIYVFESEVDQRGRRVGANGWYNPKDGSIHIDLYAGTSGEATMLFTLAHELTHFIKQWSPAKFKTLANFLMKEYGQKGVSVETLVRAQLDKAKAHGRTISYDTAYEEVIADSMETMLSDGKVIEKLAKLKQQDQSLWQKIKDFISEMAAKIRKVYEGLTPDSVEGRHVAEMVDAIENLQALFTEGLVEASENYQAAEKNTTQEGGVKHSFKGYAEDGKGIYESNFPLGTPKKAKGERILKYIQDVWSKKPITLKIEDADGVRYIEAQFDPTFDESGNTQTDASKLMGGNRHGTSAEQRVTLDLADDYYQLATESRYNGRKEETGKQAATHQGVKMWHYFVNDIYFAEYGSDKLTPYTVSINVKEKADGNYFYSFSAERAEKNGEPSTQRTLHAVVNSNGEVAANGNLSKTTVTPEGKVVKNESAEALDIEVDDKTESAAPAMLMSERTWTESDYVQEREQAAKEIAKAIGVSEKKAKAYIDSINSIAKMIADDRTRLDYFSSPGRSSFVGNVEYGGSFDFSTLCKKRRLLTGTFTAIQKALPNTALTANEILDIRNRMKKADLEVSCGLCYVEGSRANMGQFAKEFLKLYKKYYPDAWQPNMADVNTPDGIEWVRINHPEVYEQYEYFWNHYGTLKPGDKNLFASQQKPKLYQLHTEYKGEILEKFNDDDNVEDKNLNGGIRLQSFSDFEIVHLIDTMQIIMDMSRVGLAGQAYTKVPDFAWALGDTGLKINLSLIAKGVDADGRLIFDDVEGMPIDTAVALRDRYSKNVGTILVAFNDEQLLAAMADERVDFIIPFHRSQWKKSQYEAMGLPAKTKDYTYMQNEKYIKPQYHEYRGRMVKDKATNYMPNEYWDFSKSGKENAEAYLEMCARNNKRPKFYKLLQNNGDGSYSLKADGSTDGYWKLLIDFKMYDNNGVGSPQMPVKPDFNMEEATRMLDEYKGGHSNFPVAQGIVDEFVKEYKDSHKDLKLSDRIVDPSATKADIEADYLFSERVQDKETLDFLNNQDTITTYKTMQLVDGKLYPPMAARTNGEYEDHSVLGAWEQATEHPELIKSGNKYKLDKGKGQGSIEAAYNPYMHSSNLVLNDQFSGAYTRDNLVTVECEVPVSELTSGYHAQYAKDSVGWHAWHTGTVAGSLRKARGIERQVFLSRWIKPVRIVPDAEVASMYKDLLDGTDIAVPDNVVTPSLLKELQNAGVPIKESGRVKYSDRDSDGNQLSKKQQEFFKDSKVRDEQGRLIPMYHGTDNPNFTVFDPQKSDDHISLFFTSDPEVANTYTSRQDYGRDVDPYNLITADSSAEQFNAAQERVGGGLRVVKISPEWIQDMKAKAERSATRLLGVANKYADLLAYNNSTGVFNYDIERIRNVTGKGVENLKADDVKKLRNAMGSGKDHAIFATDHKGASREISRIYSDTYKLFDEVWNYKIAAATPDSAIGQYTYTETNSSVPFMVDRNLDFLGHIVPGTEREMVAKAVDRMKWVEEHNLGNRYKVYLNITNPYVLDAGINYSGKMDRVSLEHSYTGDGWRVSFENAEYDEIKHMTTPDFMAFVETAFDAETSAKIKEQIAADEEAYRKEWDDLDPDLVNHDIQLQNVDMAYTEPGNWNALNFNGNENARTRDVAAWAKDNGYDGVIFKNMKDAGGYAFVKGRGGSTVATAFSSEQVKSVDNKNPTTDPDIRYSERDADSVSNRALLANAFEDLAQNDIERQRIQDYKSKVQLINAEEQKLKQLTAQIRELSFAKGPKDTKAIRDLQIQAQQTANRINTYDRQLLRLEASRPLQNVLERERKAAYKKAEQKGKEALAAYRERAVKTQQEIIKRNQESRKRGVEGREKTAMRHKIKDVVNELNQYLLRGNKDKRVMMPLKKAVAEALDAVNMDTVGAEERIAKLQDELMKAKTPEQIQEISRKIDHIQQMGDRMSNRLKALKDAYREIADSDDPLIANSHDDVIEAKMESVIENVGNTPLRDMTLAQLSEVYDMYRMVLTIIRNANKAFKAQKSESISAISNRVLEELDKAGKKKAYRLKGTEGVESFDWNNLKPVYAFERIGSGTLSEVFSNVRSGEDVWATDVTEARDYYLERSKKYGYDAWDVEKRYKFTSTSGMDFELTLPQIMSLYAYSKRDQAAEHLKKGGIVFDKATEVTMKTKLGIKAKFNPTEATAYNLSDETLQDIISKLTVEQKGFVDEMQEYLSTTMGAKGNEVSLELYGIKLFKEKFYFPLKSATQYMAKAKEQQQGEAKIKNAGFSKETVQKASNPIVLTPFMDVWAGHVNEMSMYHAFVLPMEDFYRVYNYRTPTSETMATESVQQHIQNAHNSEAPIQYIDQLLKDLNGGARSDPRESFSKALMSRFKKAAVMASMSVVVQQPTAIVRAMALVDAKHFGIAPISRGVVRTVNARKHRKLWNEVKQYAPVAIIKEMGYFDTNMGMSTKDFITAKEYSGIRQKAKALFTDSNYRDEKISRLPALADEMAWVAIWEAVKREMLHKHKDLSTGSEGFLKAVGERFTEVITKTQVYDSVLARSGNMRSKTAFMNMWTSFMAEPTTSINMVLDALRKGKTNKRYAARTIGAVFGSVILNAALVSLVYAMRDDDEDETFAEKYLARLTTEVLDGINPLTYIPFLKDVWSIMQGFDIERADMSLITDLVDTLQKAVKVFATDTDGMDEGELSAHHAKVAETLWSVADNIASLTGIPLKNVRRDINGVINLFETIMMDADGRKTTAGSLLDVVLADVKASVPVWGWLPGESKADKLYDAIVGGDTVYVERLRSGYKTEDSYNSAIRKALRNNDPRIREAAIAWNAADLDEYMRIAREIIGEKHFTQDNVVMAIRAEASALAPEDSEPSASKAKGLFTAESFAAAIVQGDSTMAGAIKDDIIQTDRKNGKTAEEAEKSFASSATSELKEQFLAGNITDRDTVNALVAFCGKSEESAVADVQYWAFKQQHPETYADDAWFDKYYEDVADSGIDIEQYMDYRNQVRDITGEGKKEKRMAVIDSLPLTASQKDALYFAEGWAESTLNEAPWRR